MWQQLWLRWRQHSRLSLCVCALLLLLVLVRYNGTKEAPTYSSGEPDIKIVTGYHNGKPFTTWPCARTARGIDVINLVALKPVKQDNGNSFLEVDWIFLQLFETLRGAAYVSLIPYEIVEENVRGRVFCNNSIVINFARDESLMEYFEIAKAIGINVLGAVHLNDEHPDCQQGWEWYRFTNFVIRPFWSRIMERSYGNLLWMPLGWKAGYGPIPDSAIFPASSREHLCSFAGTLNKRARRRSFSETVKKDGRCFLYATEEFESRSNPDVRDYRSLLLNSAIAPCPAGWNRESYRIYEALEAGAIPVIDGTLGNEVECKIGDNESLAPLEEFCGGEARIPKVQNWSEFPALLDRLSQPGVLDATQRALSRCWTALKNNRKESIRATVLSFLRATS